MRNGMKIGIIAVVIVLLGAAYWLYEDLTGNHVEIQNVISSQTPQPEKTIENETESLSPPAEKASVDGGWSIQNDSKTYFSITTSKETVNYQMADVTGTWTLNTQDPTQTKAEGTVQLGSMDSGSSQRDNHIKGSEYMNISQFPIATFKATSFEGLPDSWIEGTIYPLQITGELTVKGITKEVVFTGQVSYEQDSLKLEESTVVTFQDFGMTSPHNVVMETENNIKVELRLVLKKA